MISSIMDNCTLTTILVSWLHFVRPLKPDWWDPVEYTYKIDDILRHYLLIQPTKV